MSAMRIAAAMEHKGNAATAHHHMASHRRMIIAAYDAGDIRNVAVVMALSCTAINFVRRWLLCNTGGMSVEI